MAFCVDSWPSSENGQSNGKKRKRAGGRPGEGSSDEEFEQEAKDREVRGAEIRPYKILRRCKHPA